MIHFQYHAPTQVIFGQDSYLQAPRLIQEAGASRILVHYGRRSVIRSGLLSRMLSALQDAGIPYETLGGVRPNPRLSLVHEGISLVRKNRSISSWPSAAEASSTRPRPLPTAHATRARSGIIT